jgi:hypothetical protein
MDGSATGVGVNVDRSSDKLAIVFEGGGACFNTTSCSSVAHADGFAEPELEEFAEAFGDTGIFDRDDADNPLADWSYVFVPYCTGDIHAGNAMEGFGGRNQVGYVNSGNAITEASVQFEGTLSQVLVAGQSAGGFGAAYNYDQAVTAFEGVRVDLLDDSGPPLSPTYLTPCFEEMVRSTWNLDDTLPADCEACDDGLGALVEFYSEKYPDNRQGYISSLEDITIRQFIGFGYPDCEDYEIPMDAEVFAAGVAELRDEIVAPLDNATMFTPEGDVHVWTVGHVLSEVTADDVDLATWLGALVE